MVDNVTLNSGTGGAVCATDDVAGIHYQRVKLVDGTLEGTDAIPGTAVNGLDVDVTRIIPGTSALLLGKAEDDAAASGDTGVAALTVRQDTPASTTTADGDYQNLKTDSTGRLWVNASGVAVPITDNAGSLTVDGSVSFAAAIPTGDNNIGNVDIVTLPNVTLAAGTNTNEVVGDAAHDSVVAGNPVLIGVEARSSDGTAVASGDVVRLIVTLLGKQIYYPYSIPGMDWHSAAVSGGIVNTTGVTAKAAAGVGIRNYVTRAEIINGHATVSTDVQIRDGASGTVLWRGFAQAAGGGCIAVFDPPLRGTANTLIEVACGTTGSATYFNLHGFAAAEQGP